MSEGARQATTTTNLSNGLNRLRDLFKHEGRRLRPINARLLPDIGLGQPGGFYNMTISRTRTLVSNLAGDGGPFDITTAKLETSITLMEGHHQNFILLRPMVEWMLGGRHRHRVVFGFLLSDEVASGTTRLSGTVEHLYPSSKGAHLADLATIVETQPELLSLFVRLVEEEPITPTVLSDFIKELLR